jgi:formate dehydrogenase maturation protein FdhE
VVSRDFQALADARAARARLLAGRYPASREALLFFAQISALQQRFALSITMEAPAGRELALESLLPGRQSLVELVAAQGPERLRQEARCLDEPACREALRAYLARQDTISPRSFFARVLLQPAMFCRVTPAFDGDAEAPATRAERGGDNRAAVCPRCEHAPQVGCLRPEGDGQALTLLCSLCLREWPFPRSLCPACGNADHHTIGYYSTPGFAQLQVQVCEACRGYLHLVDFAKEKNAVADVDELAAVPLDVWAIERGYRKVQPNLAGI